MMRRGSPSSLGTVVPSGADSSCGFQARWLLVLVLLLSCSGRVEQLLARGQYQAVLSQVRPVAAQDYWFRARALRGLGRLEEARTELLIGLALEDDSSPGHELLGRVELALGNNGSALEHLELALKLAGGRGNPELRRTVARLLARRAQLRDLPCHCLQESKEAKADLVRAQVLDPALAVIRAKTCTQCPGPLHLPSPDMRPVPGACLEEKAARALARLQRQELLLGCRGTELALRLENEGCLETATRLWQAMSKEAPSDPRWYLQTARLLLARGQQGPAQQLLLDYLYYSSAKAEAQLTVARLLLAAGHKRQAAAQAVKALPYTRQVRLYQQCIQLLKRAGFVKRAKQVAELIAK